MRYSTKFNPDRDFNPVVEGLAVDLQKCIETNTVPDGGDEPTYNNIDDPEAIFGSPKNVFEALEMKRAFQARGERELANKSTSGENA